MHADLPDPRLGSRYGTSRPNNPKSQGPARTRRHDRAAIGRRQRSTEGLSRLREGGIMRDVSSGFVRTADGVRLYYRAHGHGHDHLIVPGAVLVEDDLLPLAEGRTVVFFDH